MLDSRVDEAFWLSRSRIKSTLVDGVVDEFMCVVANEDCVVFEHGNVKEVHLVLEDAVEVEGAVFDVDEGFDCEILVVGILGD